MVTIIVRSYRKEICFQTLKNSQSITYFNRTTCLLIKPERRLHRWQLKLQTSFHQHYGLRTSQSQSGRLQNMGSHARDGAQYKQKILNVDELRECIVKWWDHLDQSIIDSAISHRHTWLQACVREGRTYWAQIGTSVLSIYWVTLVLWQGNQPSFICFNIVTVTKVFIMRFLLKDRKCSTKSFTYVQRSSD